MAQSSATVTEDVESLNNVYDDAMKLFEIIENTSEPTNSDPVQLNIRAAIAKFEKATRLVSLANMFSTNENMEELPTETLRYLLLPFLLGNLTLKLVGRPRTDIINVAEIYFKDFVTRCKNYGIASDLEIPNSEVEESDSNVEMVVTEKVKIANLVMSRDAKIKRYKELNELKKKLVILSKALESPNVDDQSKREYFTTLLYSYINQAVDELNSIQQEKPLLEYMAKHAGEKKPPAPRGPPLRPVIIARDAVQKAVFGAGYPALPSLTVEEFYNQRVRDGIFPSASNIPHSTIQNADTDADEAEQIRREQLVEDEDEQELGRQRAMDEYKDDHRRGWGNRHNRS